MNLSANTIIRKPLSKVSDRWSLCQKINETLVENTQPPLFANKVPDKQSIEVNNLRSRLEELEKKKNSNYFPSIDRSAKKSQTEKLKKHLQDLKKSQDIPNFIPFEENIFTNGLNRDQERILDENKARKQELQLEIQKLQLKIKEHMESYEHIKQNLQYKFDHLKEVAHELTKQIEFYESAMKKAENDLNLVRQRKENLARQLKDTKNRVDRLLEQRRQLAGEYQDNLKTLRDQYKTELGKAEETHARQIKSSLSELLTERKEADNSYIESLNTIQTEKSTKLDNIRNDLLDIREITSESKNQVKKNIYTISCSFPTKQGSKRIEYLYSPNWDQLKFDGDSKYAMTWNGHEVNNGYWKFIHKEDNIYYIRNTNDGQYLHCPNHAGLWFKEKVDRGGVASARYGMTEKRDNPNKRYAMTYNNQYAANSETEWRLQDIGNNTFYIISMVNDGYLNIYENTYDSERRKATVYVNESWVWIIKKA